MSKDEMSAQARVIAKAWTDAAFKKSLLDEPNAVLSAEGVSVPPGVTMKIVEDTETTAHFILPLRPASTELTIEDLQQLAGGVTKKCRLDILGRI